MQGCEVNLLRGRKKLGGDGYVHYLDCGAKFMHRMCQNNEILEFNYVQFILSKLYLNKAVFFLL